MYRNYGKYLTPRLNRPYMRDYHLQNKQSRAFEHIALLSASSSLQNTPADRILQTIATVVRESGLTTKQAIDTGAVERGLEQYCNAQGVS